MPEVDIPHTVLAPSAETIEVDGVPVELPTVEENVPVAAPQLPDVTDADGWRAITAPTKLQLPSGAKVMVRRPDWMMLRGMGEISPDELKVAILGGETHLEERMKLARRVLPHIVVQPKVVQDGTEYDRRTTIAVVDIFDSDIIAAFMWAVGLYNNPRTEVANGAKTKEDPGSDDSGGGSESGA